MLGKIADGGCYRRAVGSGGTTWLLYGHRLLHPPTSILGAWAHNRAIPEDNTKA